MNPLVLENFDISDGFTLPGMKSNALSDVRLSDTALNLKEKKVEFPEPAKKPHINTERVGPNYKQTETPEVGTTQREFTASEKMQMYTAGMVYGIKAGQSLANGFLANASAKLKARNYKFQAEQDLRSAEMLLKNQKEISRAAQMDANVYKLQGAETKDKQKVAMAQTGFAVGKGIYKNTLNTTDARTNYNVSAVILKGELQNAELTRQAGLYRAQAEIARGNAKIAKIQGRAEMWAGIVDAAAYAVASGANFYVGKYGTTSVQTKTTTVTKG